jgi:sec-independent protein translocase protein TatA
VWRIAAVSLSCEGVIAMFGAPGPMEMLIVGMVVLLLFGNRLPSVMRSLGVGITEFKKGIRGEGLDDEDGRRLEESRRDERRLDSPRSATREEEREEVHR